MGNRFFIGADAGCIGYTEAGYPIYDHRIVMVKNNRTDKVKGIYQVQTVWGIMEDGEFVEAKPKFDKYLVAACDPEFVMTYWVGDRQIPEAELVTQYKVTDITDIVKAVEKFGEKNSPYVSTECLEIFNRSYKLDGRRKRGKAIIAAVKAVMTD